REREREREGRRERKRERVRACGRGGYSDPDLAQQLYNHGPCITQIYEARSRPNQNLDLSAMMPIYKHLVAGTRRDLAGACIFSLPQSPPSVWADLDQCERRRRQL
ncbi:unnamed protein product, partial [Gadus morhua 'NCC']